MSSFQAIGPSFGRGDSPLNQFTHTFVLGNAADANQALSEIPGALVASLTRKRRAHQKSKHACENCRRRRVKCNEELPCEGCTRRGEICRIPEKSRDIIWKVPRASSLQQPSRGSGDAVVNLDHMRLFHHFETYTRPTLLYDQSVWKTVLRLSFKFEFLMNSILCIAARHLSSLHSDVNAHAAVAARHLFRALSLFQHELSNNFLSIHVDAFIATSFLLLYEAWAQSPVLVSNDDFSLPLDGSADVVFAISSSLKKTFLKSVPLISQQFPSAFLSEFKHNPMIKLGAVAQISDASLDEYHRFFAHSRPFCSEMIDSLPSFKRSIDNGVLDLWKIYTCESVDPIESGYMPAIGRLCLILSFLPEFDPPKPLDGEASQRVQDLAQCIVMFPIACHGAFASMVQRGDPHALVLLYHFYRATRILLCSSEYWWAHGRAVKSEISLKEYLSRLSAN